MLTTEEVAERLGVSPGRVRQFVSQERLSAVKEGRSLLFEDDEVSRFERQQRNPGRPSSAEADQLPLETVNGAQGPAQGRPQRGSAGGEGQEVVRLRRENARLRQELQQAQALVDALVAGGESVSRTAVALQELMARRS